MVDQRELASTLQAAFLTGTRLTPPPALTELDLDAAYAVQNAVIGLRVASGLRPAGWKLGNTSAVKQHVMGIPSPLFGRLFVEGRVDDGAVVPISRFINPRVEPELLFGLAHPLAADASRAELLAAIAWVAPALEITDSRFAAGRRTAIELIVDNTSAAGYVIGEPRTLAQLPPLASIDTVLRRNGNALAVGSTADVLGDPLSALALLARHAAARGASVEAGEIVLSGAITDAFPVSGGDRIVAELKGVGSVAVAFDG